MTATAGDRYRDAMNYAMGLLREAYDETSVPAPHPVRWKRWLRRPYRKVNHVAFMNAVHRKHAARR